MREDSSQSLEHAEGRQGVVDPNEWVDELKLPLEPFRVATSAVKRFEGLVNVVWCVGLHDFSLYWKSKQAFSNGKQLWKLAFVITPVVLDETLPTIEAHIVDLPTISVTCAFAPRNLMGSIYNPSPIWGADHIGALSALKDPKLLRTTRITDIDSGAFGITGRKCR